MANAQPLARRSPWVVTGSIAGTIGLVWLAALGPTKAAQVLAEGWPVTLTMTAGSFIAGASSEGGGAVAFPVFTKLLQVAPVDAKLFALLIQSIGMTAASLTIVLLRVRVDWKAIALTSVGGAAGVAVGLLFVAPIAPAGETRVAFTAVQAGFACVLFWSLRAKGGRARRARLDSSVDAAWIAAAGLLGGVASGLVGSGIDLALFAVLTLRFGVSEKVATPTSVIVMAINSLMGVAVYFTSVGAPPPAVVGMWLAAVPVVALGAPVGAWVCSRLRRTTIARCLLVLIAIEVATTAWLLPHSASTVVIGTGVSFGCAAVCFMMARRGRRRLNASVAPTAAAKASPVR
ncbi:MAG: sulfite exporter TauE/SafE family protein [Planctomycetota bacterium]